MHEYINKVSDQLVEMHNGNFMDIARFFHSKRESGAQRGV